MSAHASAARKRKAAVTSTTEPSPALTTPVANASVDVADVGTDRPKRPHQAKATAVATPPSHSEEPLLSASAPPAACTSIAKMRPKRHVAGLVEGTHKSVDGKSAHAPFVNGMAITPEPTRKRSSMGVSGTPAPSTKKARYVKATGKVGASATLAANSSCAGGHNHASISPSQCGVDFTEPVSAPAGARRKKMYATIIYYEAALVAQTLLQGPEANITSPADPNLQGKRDPGGVDEGSNNSEDGHPEGSNEEPPEEDIENSDASESEDDLNSRVPRVLEAHLVTERPVWTVRSSADKGKARAVDAASGSEGDSNADEYVPDNMEELEHKSDEGESELEDDVAIVVSALVAPKKPSRTGGKNKLSTKRDFQHTLERPVWKATNAQLVDQVPQAAPPDHSVIVTSQVLPAVLPGVAPTSVQGVTLPITPAATHPAIAQSTAAGIAIAPAASASAPQAISFPVPALPATGLAEFGDDSDNDISHPHENDLPDDYNLMPPVHAGAVLPLNTQHTRIQAMMRNAFSRIEAVLAFGHAPPNALGRSQAPNQRISTFRSAIKRATDAHIVAFYNIVPAECADKVEWLFSHLMYIYPHDYAKRAVPWSKPYQHPAISAVLRACFWSGTTPFANRHLEHFTTSMLSRPEELEIPAPMLALVGTALHASLLEWKSGTHRALAFSGDAYADVYNEHVLLLTGIRKQNPHAYHTMMHRLYNAASGHAPIVGPPATAQDALAHVDINAMDTD